MKQVIVDVREEDEFKNGHVDGAINIPPMELMQGASQLADVPKDAQLILYCKTGARSNVAKNILAQNGFTNIVNGINKDHVEAMLSRR